MAEHKRTRFFGGQAQRLLREDAGWTADLLAEELYALKREPIVTDSPITIVMGAGSDQPAIRIIDNTGGTVPPIVIRNGPDGDDEPFPGGGGGGGGGDGSGDGGSPDDTTTPPHGDGSDNTIGPRPPPPGTPYRIFTGELRVVITEPPPDTGGWNGQQPAFTSNECRPYNPPTIEAPTTAMAMPGILDQLNAFIARNNLSGRYIVIVDKVTGPGGTCTPSA